MQGSKVYRVGGDSTEGMQGSKVCRVGGGMVVTPLSDPGSATRRDRRSRDPPPQRYVITGGLAQTQILSGGNTSTTTLVRLIAGTLMTSWR